MINRIRAGMVCIDDAKILSIKQRDPKSGDEFWSLPGGGIEAAETALEAAIRETREETVIQSYLNREASQMTTSFFGTAKHIIVELIGSREH